MIIFTFTF